MRQAALLWAIVALLSGCAKSSKQAPDTDGGKKHGDAGGSTGDGGPGIGADAGPDAANGGGGSGGSSGSGGGHAGSGGQSGSGGTGGTGPVPPHGAPWVAFTKIESAFGQLYFVKADGTGEHKLKGTASETDPVWSPSGKQLAFVQFESGAGNSLRVIDFDKGTNVALGSDWAKLTRPRWSPDGKVLIVSATTSTVTVPALFRVAVASGTTTQITSAMSGDAAQTMGDGAHDVAPDGTVYFVRNIDGFSFDVFSIAYTADPSADPVRVTTGTDPLGGVSVNPDGKRIYYARAKAATSELVEHTLLTGNLRVIGDDADEEPLSFFDGGIVLSRHSFDGDSEIVVTDADGVLINKCTDDPEFDTAPSVSSLHSSEVDVTKF